MTTAGPLTIGFMAPTTRTRPHFASFLRIVPADVTIAFGDLGIVRRSLTDLADRMDAILATTAAGTGVLTPRARTSPVRLERAL